MTKAKSTEGLGRARERQDDASTGKYFKWRVWPSSFLTSRKTFPVENETVAASRTSHPRRHRAAPKSLKKNTVQHSPSSTTSATYTLQQHQKTKHAPLGSKRGSAPPPSPAAAPSGRARPTALAARVCLPWPPGRCPRRPSRFPLSSTLSMTAGLRPLTGTAQQPTVAIVIAVMSFLRLGLLLAARRRRRRRRWRLARRPARGRRGAPRPCRFPPART